MKITYAPTRISNFHNSNDINLNITGETASVNDGYGDDAYIISAGQAKRINNHFCGISDCQCPQGGTIDTGNNHAILIKYCY